MKRAPVDWDARLLNSRQARRYLKSSKLETVELVYFLYLPEALSDKAPGLETAPGGIPLGGQYDCPQQEIVSAAYVPRPLPPLHRRFAELRKPLLPNQLFEIGFVSQKRVLQIPALRCDPPNGA